MAMYTYLPLAIMETGGMHISISGDVVKSKMRTYNMIKACVSSRMRIGSDKLRGALGTVYVIKAFYFSLQIVILFVRICG